MKNFISLIAAVLISVASFAQSGVHTTKGGVRFVNGGDGSFLNHIPGSGTIFYDDVAQKFKKYENGVISDLVPAAGAFWNLSGTSTLSTGSVVIEGGATPAYLELGTPSSRLDGLSIEADQGGIFITDQNSGISLIEDGIGGIQLVDAGGGVGIILEENGTGAITLNDEGGDGVVLTTGAGAPTFLNLTPTVVQLRINSSLGSPGDVLTSDGTNATWQAPGGGGGWPLTGSATLTGDVEISGDAGTYSTSIGTIAGNMLNFNSYGSGDLTFDYGGNTQLYGNSGNSQLQLNTTGVILESLTDMNIKSSGTLTIETTSGTGGAGEVLTADGLGGADWAAAGGGITAADNGLTKYGSLVKLGGDLLKTAGTLPGEDSTYTVSIRNVANDPKSGTGIQFESMAGDNDPGFFEVSKVIVGFGLNNMVGVGNGVASGSGFRGGLSVQNDLNFGENGFLQMGIQRSSGNGWTLTGDAVGSLALFQQNFDASLIEQGFQMNSGSSVIIKNVNQNIHAAGSSQIDLTNDGVIIKSNGTLNSELRIETHPSIDANSVAQFTDFRTTKRGIEYFAAGYVTTARSLADKDYVDVAVSDIRLKTDIEPMDKTKALASLNQVEPIKFHWDKSKRPLADDYEHYGVSAQQLAEVLPETVSEAEDGTLGVRRDQVVGLLIASVQELTSRVEELESRVQELEKGAKGKRSRRK